MTMTKTYAFAGAVLAGALATTALASPASAQQFGVPAATRMALQDHYIFVFTHEVLP